MILFLHENRYFDNLPDAIGKVYRSGDFIPRIGETVSIKNFKMENPTNFMQTVKIGGISMTGCVFKVHYDHDNHVHIHMRMTSEIDIEILRRWNKNVVNLQDYTKEDFVVFKKEDESEGLMVRTQSGIDEMQEPVIIIFPDDTIFVDPHFFIGLLNITKYVPLEGQFNVSILAMICDRYKFISNGRYRIDAELKEAIDIAMTSLTKA